MIQSLNANDYSVNAASLAVNTWYHVAFVRSGSSLYIFQNGVQAGTTGNAFAMRDCATTLKIGYLGTGATYLNGWLDEFRISKGVARWTSNLTPSTSVYSDDSNTVLLLDMDGADGSTTFIDDVSG
jgi:hypothetical protein